MAILEERIFPKGLDTDTELRSVAQGDYLLPVLNIRIADVSGNSIGIVKNIKGNELVSFTLPSGNNTCIHSMPDKNTQQVYYFVYNSLGNHGIYRFSQPNTIEVVFQDNILDFDINHLINHANLVDGKLLYWTDGFRPQRKINVLKALENKERKYNVYFGKASATGENYSFIAKLNGVQVFRWDETIPMVTPKDAFGVSHYLASNTPPLAPFTTESCGAALEFTFKSIGAWTLEATSTNSVSLPLPNQVIVVADNFYPKPYSEDFIDRLKYPKPKEPTSSFQFNPSVKSNLVKEGVFQFAVQYIYDDNEKTTLSPYSVISAFDSQCTSIPASAYNFIRIDFTDIRLNTPSIRSIFRYVNLLFREHNDGKWKLITQLQPEDWGINSNTFDFYNNGIYKVLSDVEANTLFTNMPQLSRCQEFIGQKLLDADITEGYDPVCVDADLAIKYTNTTQQGTFSISGKILIDNYHKAGFWQPIHDEGNGSVYGGINVLNDAPANIGTAHNQGLPLYGFVVYLAGTDFFGVSRQAIQTTDPTKQDQDTGVYKTDTHAKRAFVMGLAASGDVYSDFKIEGVRPGVYVLRIASNSTVNIASPYQLTSMPVSMVAGAVGFESIVEVMSNGDVVNISTGITNTQSDQYQVEQSIVYDLLNANVAITSLQQSIGITGYLKDGAGSTPPINTALAMLEKGIERSSVFFTAEIFYPTAITLDFSANYSVPTDHNGFFFFSFIQPPAHSHPFNSKTVVTVNNANVAGDFVGFEQAINVAAYTNLALNEVTSTQPRHALVYYRNTNATIYNNDRTRIQGYVNDIAGNPVPGVAVVITRGGFGYTDNTGLFSIFAYAAQSRVRGDEIIFSSPNSVCFFEFTNNNIPFNINIKIPAPPNYDHNNPYLSGTFIASFLNVILNSAFKRGFDGSFGIVYYDRGLRSGSVNTNEKLQAHINFYTEKDFVTNKLLPSGIPDVSWSIKHLPPEWATHYQWVRTKNMQVSSYLQFTANRLQYVDALPITSAASSPTVLPYNDPRVKYVRIDLTNLTFYQGQNKDSVLGYTWQVGDRIRFIKNSVGSLFHNYYDYKIEQFNEEGAPVTGNWIYFVFDNSMPDMTVDSNQPSVTKAPPLFEIYTPRPSTIEKLYFEFGETFRVLKDSNGNVYHEGLTQNQDPLNPISTPATGSFRTGDAYYRHRSIPYGDTFATIVATPTYSIDDGSISDFYLSNDQSIGRINIEDRNAARIRREKSFRWSLDYIQNTKINDLSWFQASDELTLQKGDGSINKLQSAGRNVLAIQSSHVSDLYIYESQFLDNSGTPNIVKSQQFIGTVNPLKKLVGTINPESVKEWEGDVYGYDGIKGVAWRYAQDGIDIISDYQAISFFVSKTQEIQGKNVRVFGYLDPSNQEYGLTFAGDTPQTIIFCDQVGCKRWISPYSFIGENYSYSGMEVIAFDKGALWVQERNPVRNNFFGVQYFSQITIVSNENNSKIRNFLDMVVDGSDVWWAQNIGDVSIDSSVKYPDGMQSRLRKNKFRRVQTDWYAPFMKDAKTPNKVSVDEALVNGRDLAGHAIKITLMNDSTDEVTLKSVGVRYIINELTKK